MKMFTSEEPLTVQRQFTENIEKIGNEIRDRFFFIKMNSEPNIISEIWTGPYHTSIFYRNVFLVALMFSMFENLQFIV